MEDKKYVASLISKGNPLGKNKEYPKCKMVGNSPLWRAINERMIKDIASISFGYAVGDSLTDDEETTTSGIMRFLTYPSYGSSWRDGALNKAAGARFNYQTQGYTSANVPYQGSDVFCYEESITSGIAVMITCGKRAYGLMKSYSFKNRFRVRGIIESLGFNYDSLNSSLADFRSELNTIIDEINNSFKVAIDSNTFKIKQNIYGRIFTDGLGAKSQTYAFVPKYLPIFDETSLTTGSALRMFKTGFDGKLTVTQYFNKLNQMIDPIRNNKDINTISKDTLAVYKDRVVVIPEITENDYVSFDYDPVMLNEIHNINVCSLSASQANHSTSPNYGFHAYFNDLPNDIIAEGDLAESNAADIGVYQDDTGALLASYTVQSDGRTFDKFDYLHIMDLSMEEVSSSDILDSASFMVAFGRSYLTGGNVSAELYSSTDVVDTIEIFTMQPDPTDEKGKKMIIKALTPIRSDSEPNNAYGTTGLTVMPDVVAQAAQFDYHPPIFQIAVTGYPMDITATKVYRHQDIYNFAKIANQTLINLFDKSWYAIVKVEKNVASATD